MALVYALFLSAVPGRLVAASVVGRQGVTMFVETGVDLPDSTPTWYAIAREMV